jgi:hypothetical protein
MSKYNTISNFLFNNTTPVLLPVAQSGVGASISVCNTKWLKIANFARLYYPHFTTFRNETLEYY